MKHLKKISVRFLLGLMLVGFSTNLMAQDRGAAVQAFNKALELAKSNEYDQAIEMYNQAIAQAEQLGEEGQDIVQRVEKQLPSIYYQKALASYKEFQKAKSLSSLETTIENFQEASEMSSEYGNDDISGKADQVVTQLYYTKSILQYKSSNYSESLASLNQAIERNPNYAKAYYQKGIVLKNQESSNFERALEQFDQAIEVGNRVNDNQIVRKAREAAHDELLYRGSKATESKNYKTAVTLLDRALEYETESADAHYRLAEAYNKQALWNQAISHANTALELENGGRTEKAKIYFELGTAYKNQGNVEQACGAFKNAAFGSFKSPAEHQMEFELKCESTTN
ncbi:tetratricopeptide repeat protein [Halalkalibaculum roseum]|uniref:tetratricopeptide repeat protein n=1 Tax=Halalkalibaculum roseum TaxID=2709311 RepID=UPI0013EBAB8A|nr:tetratricopeptide repeat protein [Halalkalibaculum roseum]